MGGSEARPGSERGPVGRRSVVGEVNQTEHHSSCSLQPSAPDHYGRTGTFPPSLDTTAVNPHGRRRRGIVLWRGTIDSHNTQQHKLKLCTQLWLLDTVDSEHTMSELITSDVRVVGSKILTRIT